MGRREGGLKSAAKIKAYYGEDFYARIGKVGGTKSRGGGFTDKELARRAGALGGRKSRRRPAKYKWVEDKPETLFVDEAILVDEEFGDGFFRPTLRQRMLNKLRSR